jgi:hypothetical protein
MCNCRLSARPWSWRSRRNTEKIDGETRRYGDREKRKSEDQGIRISGSKEFLEISYTLRTIEAEMEASQEKVEIAPVSQMAGFEPEILAFCCEH